jgi:hypothetical protein
MPQEYEVIWFWLIVILTVFGAAASIDGAIDDHRDIRSGHPSLDTLISMTGITNRKFFIELIGEPDEDDCFEVPAERVSDIPTTWWTIVDHPIFDLLCILIAIAAPFVFLLEMKIGLSLLGISAGFQSAGYSYAMLMVFRSESQNNNSYGSR